MTDSGTVKRAIDPARFTGVRHGTMVRIRSTIERMLAAKGWCGVSADLWNEFDKNLLEAA